jgi:hypothetical protein
MYPGIEWSDTTNREIHLCMALFNDAAQCYDKLKAMDSMLEQHADLLPLFVDMDERNNAAHTELRTYEKTKTFAGIHPITVLHKKEDKLIALMHSDPSAFLRLVSNTHNNINRYKNYIAKQKYKDDEQRQAWASIIVRDSELLASCELIIKSRS